MMVCPGCGRCGSCGHPRPWYRPSPWWEHRPPWQPYYSTVQTSDCANSDQITHTTIAVNA